MDTMDVRLLNPALEEYCYTSKRCCMHAYSIKSLFIE